MIRIGLIDDDLEHMERMRGFLARFEREEGCSFQVNEFRNGLNFVEDYNSNLDVVFLDIEMPLLNGMDAAKKIREKDSSVAIIFVTCMAQYAIQGYEVNAVDFIVKPVSYFVFADKLRKALQYMRLNTHKTFLLQTETDAIKVTTVDILYIEKDKNYLIYHTRRGDFRIRGTMTATEAELRNEGFSKCLSGCIVNLRYVTGMNKDTVWIEQITLPISRHRYKEFKDDFLRYLGGDL